MSSSRAPDIVVYVCTNCIPQAAKLPRQWSQQAARVFVREVPCSGKMDGQYLLHGLEGGARGLCVVACPKGECHLAQGNYRAEMRIGTLRQLLEEIGLEAGRVELVHACADDSPEEFEIRVRSAVERILRLGESPLRAVGG